VRLDPTKGDKILAVIRISIGIRDRIFGFFTIALLLDSYKCLLSGLHKKYGKIWLNFREG